MSGTSVSSTPKKTPKDKLESKTSDFIATWLMGYLKIEYQAGLLRKIEVLLPNTVTTQDRAFLISESKTAASAFDQLLDEMESLLRILFREDFDSIMEKSKKDFELSNETQLLDQDDINFKIKCQEIIDSYARIGITLKKDADNDDEMKAIKAAFESMYHQTKKNNVNELTDAELKNLNLQILSNKIDILKSGAGEKSRAPLLVKSFYKKIRQDQYEEAAQFMSSYEFRAALTRALKNESKIQTALLSAGRELSLRGQALQSTVRTAGLLKEEFAKIFEDVNDLPKQQTFFDVSRLVCEAAAKKAEGNLGDAPKIFIRSNKTSAKITPDLWLSMMDNLKAQMLAHNVDSFQIYEVQDEKDFELQKAAAALRSKALEDPTEILEDERAELKDRIDAREKEKIEAIVKAKRLQIIPAQAIPATAEAVEVYARNTQVITKLPAEWFSNNRSLDEQQEVLVRVLMDQMKDLPTGTTVVIGNCYKIPAVAIKLHQMATEAGLNPSYSTDGTRAAVKAYEAKIEGRPMSKSSRVINRFRG